VKFSDRLGLVLLDRALRRDPSRPLPINPISLLSEVPDARMDPATRPVDHRARRDPA